MNKQAFIDTLTARTAGLPESERARLVAYFTEIIDDSIEDGVPEDEAVAALGSPDELLRELEPTASRSAQPAAGTAVEALRSLSVRVQNADVVIRRAPLENGAAAQAQFSHPERFTWRMDGDTLVIEEKAAEAKFSFLGIRLTAGAPSGDVTVTLSGDLEGDFTFAGYGGDLSADGLRIGRAISVNSASGDVNLWNADCGGDITAHSGSGEIELRALCCAQLRVSTGSGDIELDRCHAAGVRVKSGSGDVRLVEVGADGALSIEVASGDVEAERCNVGELMLSAASGDVDVDRCHAPSMRLNTASGDIDVKLENRDRKYDIHADTRSGDIMLPEHRSHAAGDAECEVYARTASGDISVSYV